MSMNNTGATAKHRSLLKHSVGWCASVLLLNSLSVAAYAQSGGQVIDGFTTGTARIEITGAGEKTSVQSGSMAGGHRFIRYIVRQSSKNTSPGGVLRVAGNDRKLVVSNDYGSPHRIELKYGVDKNGRNQGLNLDLSGMTAIRVNFESIDLGVNTQLVLYSSNGASRVGAPGLLSAGTDQRVGSSGRPVPLVFKRSDFKKPEPLPNFDFSDVDFIVLIVQTGNAMQAEDYAITRLSVE